MRLPLLAVRVFSLCAALPLAAGCRHADDPIGSGPLAALVRPVPGRLVQVGSTDRNGENNDFLPVPAGKTVTLLDHNGAGIVRRFWMTIQPRDDARLYRQVILRMYWDGETTPSVEVPLGDFFGVAFPEQPDFASLPMSQTTGGFNCYWPMPFRRAARWTLENRSQRDIGRFYYNVSVETHANLPVDYRYFHAQFRRVDPAPAGQDVTLLEATGSGHFVGAVVAMQGGRSLFFLEGNERIWIDGARTPSIEGTGTEDYFSGGWYFIRGTTSAPYHGAIFKDSLHGRVSAYRFHVEDPIAFDRHIRVTLEHGPKNLESASYASVAYFYQTEPHAPPPALPFDPEQLLLHHGAPPLVQIPGAVEGESLVKTARASSGNLEPMYLGTVKEDPWSEGQALIWQPRTAGETLVLRMPVPKSGNYDLIAHLARSDDCGIFEVRVNGQRVGAPIDLYQFGGPVVPTGAIPVGSVHLQDGTAEITFTVTGKHAKSSSFSMAIDALVLKPR